MVPLPFSLYGSRHECVFACVQVYAATVGDEAELVLSNTCTNLLCIGEELFPEIKCICKTESKRTVNSSEVARQHMRSAAQYVVGGGSG